MVTEQAIALVRCAIREQRAVKAAAHGLPKKTALAKHAQQLWMLSGPDARGRFGFGFRGNEGDIVRPVGSKESRTLAPGLRGFGVRQVLMDFGDNNFLCELGDGSIKKVNYQDGPYGDDLSKMFTGERQFTGVDFRRGKKSLSFRKVMDADTAVASGLRKKDLRDIRKLFTRDTLRDWIDKGDYKNFGGFNALSIAVSPEIDIGGASRAKDRSAYIRRAIKQLLRQPPKNQGYGPEVIATLPGNGSTPAKELNTHSSVEFYRDHSGQPHLAFHS